MHTNSSLECRQVLYIACTKQALNMVHVNKDNANLSCTSQYSPYLYCAPLIYFVEKKKKHLGRVLSANVQELSVSSAV